MKVAGIVCEYNPLHYGHIAHIEKTRAALGLDCAIVCVMSGNFVQRGDFAVFNKHARARAALIGGADLVLELPVPYVLSSAESFASAGVYLLDMVGICSHISFGSEVGNIDEFSGIVEFLVSDRVSELLKERLSSGVSYARGLQEVSDDVLGAKSNLLRSPNNLLGIEYLKALQVSKSALIPFTIKRIGGAHDGDFGISASLIRRRMLNSESFGLYMPSDAKSVFQSEISDGRGPVSMQSAELAMLSRLRAIHDFSNLSGVSEGIDHRLQRFAKSESTISAILDSVKTKRYSMSRVRRLLLNACLGIGADDIAVPPPYAKVLAMNRAGMSLLKEAKRLSRIPLITKPAAAKALEGHAAQVFEREVAATDFYVLSYQNSKYRLGGQEWRNGPIVISR